MLRMEYEREVILSVCHRIEMYEQQQLFDDNAADEDYTPLAATLGDSSRVHLGSRQRGLKLTLYEKVLEETLEFNHFGDSLARFLRNHTLMEVYGTDFVRDGFEGHWHCIYWYKVISTLRDLINL